MMTSKKGDKAPRPETDKEAKQLMDFNGVAALIQLGMQSAEDRKVKNRIIFFLCLALTASLTWNGIQTARQPEPKLLGETSDGRIRPLPLLHEPLYSHKEILTWAERCVQSLYRLSYVDWRTSIQNETYCLSDKSREGFVDSLKQIGLLSYLNPTAQGTVYATPGASVMRAARLSAGGYQEWIVDVPYRIIVDGRQRGGIDVVMTMKIRRVSLTWREEGIWVEEYMVRPKSAGTPGA